MITGAIKNRIDTNWDTFWTGGITIQEQMTYLYKLPPQKKVADTCSL